MSEWVDGQGLDAALNRAGSVQDAAECHGLLCGFLCLAGGRLREHWLDQALAGVDRARQGELQALLERLHDEALAALQSDDLRFTPLLPGDEESLELRALALSHWARGFSEGLLLGRAAGAGELPAATREPREDIAAMGQACHDPSHDGEESEAAYIQLVEFLRVAVQLVFEEGAGSATRRASEEP